MSLCTVSISVNDKPQGSFYGGSTTVPVFTNPYGSPSCNCEARIAQLEAMIKDLTEKFAKSLTVMPGLEVRRRENSIDCLSAVNPAVDPSAVFTNLKQAVSSKEEETIEVSDDDLNEETTQYEGLAQARAAAWRAEAEAGEQVVVESGPEEEVECEEMEVDEEQEMEVDEEQEQKEEEEQEEEESIEYLEVVYKGITYYRTEADNLVYSLDDDGEVSDDPIGVWSTEKNKLLKYPTQ
jgi:hypothetical protein